MSNRVNGQSGGILVFVLVGMVLTALLAGGIYASKNQGRAAVVNQPTAVTTEPKAPNTTKPDASPAPTTPKKDAPTQTTPQPAAPSNPTPTPKPTPAPSTTAPAPSQPSGIANTGPSSIASTGPEDVLFTVVALSVIAATASAYRLSVQRMRLAALK